MNGIDQTASNRLSTAQDRLARAIGRLEAALEKRTPDIAVDPGLSAQMQDQLQGLQAENAELRTLVDSTAQRLDGTIAKFKSKLAG